MGFENRSVITINGGSSSIKFAIYEMTEKLQCKLSGAVNRIGFNNPEFTVKDSNSNIKNNLKIRASNFKEAAGYLIDWLEKQDGFERVSCIGHRIVHGMRHTRPERIDAELLKELNQIRDYDPDHLPAEIEMIQLLVKRHPGLLQIACFDTAFHAGLPRLAQILPIPRRFDQAGIQRYGFHGLSYSYLMGAIEKAYGKREAHGRIILAHLGSGASLAAVKEGKSIDTSMGFTAAGGLVMGSRTGDLDPGAAWYMIQKEGMTARQFNHLINHESGLLGISEISSNMEELLQCENSDPRAQEAVGLFCYQVKKWIGAFMAVLGGLDTLVFSGGIGANSATIRARICEGLGFAGIELNESGNKKNTIQISSNDSKVKVFVIPTNEELIIAKNAIGIYMESENKKQ